MIFAVAGNSQVTLPCEVCVLRLSCSSGLQGAGRQAGRQVPEAKTQSAAREKKITPALETMGLP